MLDSLRFGTWVSSAAQARFRQERGSQTTSTDIRELRTFYDEYNQERLAEAVAANPVRISEVQIGGIHSHIVEPAEGVRDGRRLICLHGGAFMWGSGAGAMLEAVPVAAATGMQVLAVDYRLAPEHGFPAAVDDVLCAYREMIERQDAGEIGIFGCSAGAVLAAEAVARILQNQLPVPGAIAMLHGAGLDFEGDSAQTALAFQESQSAGPSPTFDTLPYFSGVDPNDPLAVPGNDPQVLAGFPPSLLVTASRDFAASAVWVMHRRLLAAGVQAECITFDGLWHAHHMFTDLPESQETFGLLARFFRTRLKAA